jgi:DNA (cytosine-5)-methyltransferase 1
MREIQKHQLTVASFFSGIGGFDLAFEQAGAKVVFQCEKDSFCQKVLKKHWPNVHLMTDIEYVWPNDIENANIWCAGFPCQDLSLANQGKRKGLEGNRSGLFNTFAELVGSEHPAWVVLENVPGLLNSNGGHDFKHVIQTLDDLGYFVAWRVLDAKYFGTPQRRRRVFFVASYQNDSAAGVLFDESLPRKVAPSSSIPSASLAVGSRKGFQESDLFAIQHATIGRKPDAGPQAKGYRNDGETYTLDSRGSSDVVCAPYDGFGVRNTPGISRELDSRRVRALGNAVCVNVVRWIAEGIVAVSSKNNQFASPKIKYANIDR